jgi:lipopolysaccharide biosynthesis glycosyltransferase
MLIFSPLAFAENINVAFTIDNNYPIFTLLVINSILCNNVSNSDYTFYIVENNVTDKNKILMKDYVTARGQKIEFINVDTSIIDEGDNLFGFSHRITKIAMARILLSDLLPKSVHRVIYLDGDIVVTEDLKNLYDIDLGKNTFGMALNISQMETVELYQTLTEYYNSGVILMDLDKSRKDNIVEDFLAFLRDNRSHFLYKGNVEDSHTFLYADQDLINMVMKGKIKTIPQKWNNQHIDGKSLVPFDSGGIIHYIGNVKPWNFPKDVKPEINVYYQYWKHSGLVKYKPYYAYLAMKNNFLDFISLKKLRAKKFIKIFPAMQKL